MSERSPLRRGNRIITKSNVAAFASSAVLAGAGLALLHEPQPDQATSGSTLRTETFRQPRPTTATIDETLDCTRVKKSWRSVGLMSAQGAAILEQYLGASAGQLQAAAFGEVLCKQAAIGGEASTGTVGVDIEGASSNDEACRTLKLFATSQSSFTALYYKPVHRFMTICVPTNPNVDHIT